MGLEFNNEGERLLYSGDSLDEYLKVINLLEQHHIKFTKQQKNHDSWLSFLLLQVIGTGSYGMHGERTVTYKIYVNSNIYDEAKTLINDENVYFKT
jgi:hypothetical protein